MELQPERQVYVTLCSDHNKPCEHKCHKCGKKMCRFCHTSTFEGHEISEIKFVEDQEESNVINWLNNSNIAETLSDVDGSVPSYAASCCNQFEDSEDSQDANTNEYGSARSKNEPHNERELTETFMKKLDQIDLYKDKMSKIISDKCKQKKMNLKSRFLKKITECKESAESNKLIDNSNIFEINATKHIGDFIIETNIPVTSILDLTSNNLNDTIYKEIPENKAQGNTTCTTGCKKTTERQIFDWKCSNDISQSVFEDKSENAKCQGTFRENKVDIAKTGRAYTSTLLTPIGTNHTREMSNQLQRMDLQSLSISEPSIINRCRLKDAPKSIVCTKRGDTYILHHNLLLTHLNQDMDMHNVSILGIGFVRIQAIAVDIETDILFGLGTIGIVRTRLPKSLTNGGVQCVFNINMKCKEFAVEREFGCIAITPRGYFLLGGYRSKIIAVYTKTGQLSRCIEPDINPYHMSVCHTTGRVAISCSRLFGYSSWTIVQVMDIQLQRLYTIEVPQSNKFRFSQSAFDNAGNILVGTQTGVHVYDSESGAYKKTINILQFGRHFSAETHLNASRSSQLVLGHEGSDEILFIKYLETTDERS